MQECAKTAVVSLAIASLVPVGESGGDVAAPDRVTGRVSRVIDGDTLDLEAAGGTRRIRLSEIDAPELGQPWGDASRRALAALALGQIVVVRVTDVDRYGRSVGAVHVGELAVNTWMVRNGHAWAYTRFAETLEILESEEAARLDGAGLWALPADRREAPWEWRSQRRRERSRTPTPPVVVDCEAKRTCGAMGSCAEARATLEQCDLPGLDGDRDGIPCQRLCGGKP